MFYLRREYWRNLGAIDFVEARRLPRSDSLAEGREWARQLVRLPTGVAAYGSRNHYPKGGGIWRRGKPGRTPSRLESHNWELRRREKPGTVGREHNLLALLQIQGLLKQTT